MSTIDTKVQLNMQKELEKYLKKEYFKPYLQSMQDINTWLKKKAQL